MEKADSEYYNGYTINIYYDEDAGCRENPNDWWGDSFLVFDHRQFCIEKKGYSPQDIFDDGGRVKGYFVFRCYAYIHSGVVLSVGSPAGFPDIRWDVSSTGYWLVKREKGCYTVEKARQVAENMCSAWNTYLSGEVYGYMLEDSEEDEEGGCWGFYGYDYEKSGLLESAKAEIDWLIEERIKEAIRDTEEQMTINKNLQPIEVY